ncbi:Variable major protein (plasmid) [Borrelia coriaceae ATCC 43381]|uniref:Variable large protein n=1 Tax=Borrelia coriaceae ATCC 43381 TaxID=1408429 RepID=W5SWH1_9SPIR|nr:Variable major protein [Borrelia coriaceae ATCC 43381]
MKINIKSIKVKSICATLFISLFLSCNNGIEELDKKKSFADSLLNIGHSFQEIFTSFGNAIGDALGFNAVKPTDNRSEVGKHFEKIREGLKNTKIKLEELSKDITSAPNADTRGVEAVIKDTSDVIARLIDSVIKLAESVGDTAIVDGTHANTSTGGIAVAADPTSVNSFIEGVQGIIETAKNSGMTISAGEPGSEVAGGIGGAGAALIGKGDAVAPSSANSGPLLADEVAKKQIHGQ